MTPSLSKSATSLKISSSDGVISPKFKFLKIYLNVSTVTKPLESVSSSLKASSTGSNASIGVVDSNSCSVVLSISYCPFIKNAISLFVYYLGNACRYYFKSFLVILGALMLEISLRKSATSSEVIFIIFPYPSLRISVSLAIALSDF